MGRDAKEQAVIEMWDRRAELEGMSAAAEVVRNAAPMFVDRGIAGVAKGFPQIPQLIERGKKRMARFFDLGPTTRQQHLRYRSEFLHCGHYLFHCNRIRQEGRDRYSGSVQTRRTLA